MTSQSGPDQHRANLSARQAKKLGLMTSGTFGQHGFTSLNSCDLQLCLANKLKQQLNTDGPTLFNLTWKTLVTPSRRSVFALRGSVRRTSETERGLSRSKYGDQLFSPQIVMTMETAPAADMTTGIVPALDRLRMTNTNTVKLMENFTLAGWVTASTRDWKDSPGMAVVATNPDGSKRYRVDQLPRQAQLAKWLGLIRYKVSGETLTGCDVWMNGGGLLNPEHSRWVMGFPPEWGSCAPTEMPSSRK